jgi:VIT1/CCC1 family predicted Fe2+/Mn2+ transporter
MSSGARRGGVHSLVRRYLPDLIYGANDGIITTLAVVSGVVGASLSNRVILILGFANLIADGVSMGASNVLARRSDTTGVALPTLGTAGRHGVATFVGFVVAGIVPLLAYLVPEIGDRYWLATGMALVTLFVIGASRAIFTPAGPIRAGLEMLVIGALAAFVAYAIGALAARLTEGLA